MTADVDRAVDLHDQAQRFAQTGRHQAAALLFQEAALYTPTLGGRRVLIDKAAGEWTEAIGRTTRKTFARVDRERLSRLSLTAPTERR